jgi:hypothetical protein
MTNIPVQDLPLKSVGLLRAVMQAIHIDPEEKPQEWVLVLHANHIAQLTEEVVFLESHNHEAAAPVIARAIYESLFKLGLVVANPELSAEQTLREFEWSWVQDDFPGAHPRDLKKIRMLPQYKSIGENVLSLGKRWKLACEQIKSDKIQTTFWNAKQARMTHLYQYYAWLSGFAHGYADKFIHRHFNSTPGLVLVYVTLAVNEAMMKIANKYRNHLSDELFQEVQNFNELFRSYGKTGHIKEFLLNELAAIRPTRPTPRDKIFEKN